MDAALVRKLRQDTKGEGGNWGWIYEGEGKTACYSLNQEKKGNMDRVSTAWIEAGRGWICTCTSIIDFGVGGWRALL